MMKGNVCIAYIGNPREYRERVCRVINSIINLGSFTSLLMIYAKMMDALFEFLITWKADRDIFMHIL